MSAPDRLVVGLGNPGAEYAGTRHNLGWRTLDRLAEVKGLAGDWRMNRKEDHLLRDGRTVYLKPGSYMNESGQPVREQADYYEIKPPSVLVITDDLDLPFGDVRYRPSGGSGGHRGLGSVIRELGVSKEVPRLRLGIGRPPPEMTPIDYVLSRFSPEEEEALPEFLDRAIAALAEQLDE